MRHDGEPSEVNGPADFFSYPAVGTGVKPFGAILAESGGSADSSFDISPVFWYFSSEK
jgi:hypothetical protein